MVFVNWLFGSYVLLGEIVVIIELVFVVFVVLLFKFEELIVVIYVGFRVIFGLNVGVVEGKVIEEVGFEVLVFFLIDFVVDVLIDFVTFIDGEIMNIKK